MIYWRRACRGQCPQRLPAMAGTAGIFAATACPLDLRTECPDRRAIPMPEIDPPPAWAPPGPRLPIVAAWRPEALATRRLVDFLPGLYGHETRLLWRWCWDFRRREIPWVVCRRGQQLALFKERRI